MTDARTQTATMTDRYRTVRARTEALAAPLSPEDQQVQSMPDVSPTKWHRAHTTWFFETFLLVDRVDEYEIFDEAYAYLFNSYYESVGARHTRAARGLISRPGVDDVARYRAHVDAAMTQLLASAPHLDSASRAETLELVELGLHHEQQHQELLVMDIKHVLSSNPLNPAYHDRVRSPGVITAMGWVDVAGGVVEIGHQESGFAFDNEGPSHQVLLRDFALADRLVTCGEWLEFMIDGGYDRPLLWLSEGWAIICAQGWNAPSYWFSVDDQWYLQTLAGPRPIDPAEPVVHVSYFEADAYARWADARLPVEAEWEHAARLSRQPITGNLLDTGALHPEPAGPADGTLRQLYGDVWEWTASAYSAYPGFAADPGAVGEYNGKFMVNQMVLRGGCCATPDDHIRPSYRNFFPAGARWMFAGVRLAR